MLYFIYSSEDGDAKIDEAEEVRSGDEEAVEPEEEPEGTINQKVFNYICNVNDLFCNAFIIF